MKKILDVILFPFRIVLYFIQQRINPFRFIRAWLEDRKDRSKR